MRRYRPSTAKPNTGRTTRRTIETTPNGKASTVVMCSSQTIRQPDSDRPSFIPILLLRIRHSSS